ncbi:PWWP domain-containing protein [Aphelenchoides fujianensis]|nr:PWWP domain-containing protein [Aphelenchoides fujianensis]
MTELFDIGALVWAKMRGFPHWPAQIAKLPTVTNPKYSVYFFGTQETAFVKTTDVFDYNTHLATYGEPRRITGFQTALDEIREAAEKKGLVPPIGDAQEGAQRSRDLAAHVPELRPPPTQPNSRPPTASKEKRGLTMSSKEPQPLLSAVARKRTDSTSSTERSRKRLLSEKFGIDLSDIEPTLSTGIQNHKLLSNGGLSLFEGVESEQSEDDISKALGSGRSRRRTRSRLFDDYLFGSSFLKSPRDRSGSLSSNNGRTRLISGFSDTFDGLAEVFNPQELMQAIDDLPSEESDRPITPDEPNGANSAEAKECKRWNGAADNQLSKKAHPLSLNSWDRSFLSDLPVSDSSINDPITTLAADPIGLIDGQAPLPLITTSELPVAASSGDEATLNQIKEYLLNPHERPAASDGGDPTAKGGAQAAVGKTEFEDPFHSMPPGVRMEQYFPPKRTTKTNSRSKGRVENTPPVSADGVRYCYFCPGQVRPQMCGGNKHRWRCVDKKCRKWYGWVKSNDVIPRDLGKKGRWKDLVIRVQSSTNEFEDRLASDMISNTGADEQKGYAEHASYNNKRRYKRKGAANRDVSPLTMKEAYFEPSCMEMRSRWWLNDRRRAEYSPERKVGTNSIADAAAALRLMGNSLLTAAGTKNDEYGAFNGTVDLMMDSSAYMPGAEPPEEAIQGMWDKNSLHMPLF